MKNVFLIISTVLLLASCDYVQNPRPEANANAGDTTTCTTPVFPAVTVHTKKILIEDYTGHTCPNCPRAARKLHELDTTYPGRIIGLAIHVGSLAAPSPGHGGTPSTSFSADFRTTTGNDYDAVFGAASFGLPQGMFNRKDFDAVNQTHLKFYPNWNSYITTIIAEPSVADLQINNDYNASTGKLCCAVKATFLNTMSGTYKLCVLLVQDSIINWQDDIDYGQLPDYVHRHMLRDAINPAGAWGEAFATAPATGTSVTKKFAYIIPAQYNAVPVVPAHCSVIAFIYDTSNYEIIQSEEMKIIP